MKPNTDKDGSSTDAAQRIQMDAGQRGQVVPIAVFTVDQDRRITSWNREAERVTGYTRAEALGQPCTLFAQSTCGRHCPLFAPEVEKPTFQQECTILHKDGSSRLVAKNLDLITDADGVVVGGIESFVDVTEQRKMQTSLAQADRLSSMGMLAAGVAHEINNPLSYILYNLESLTEDLPELLRAVRSARFDDIQERFDEALAGTLRIKEITRGLGTFSRVESAQMVPVNLEQVIDAALSMCSNELKYRARMVKKYGELPTVMASAGRLSQVFLNLLVNAAHAIDEGHVEENEIQIRTWARGDTVFAEVRDTGRGISAKHLGQLFEPFFTTKEIGVGSGLGLPISRGIIEEYGGTITVESEVGKGTTFLVQLPTRTKVVTHPRKPRTEDAQGQARGRILVVDDEDSIRDIMVHMLQEHEVTSASSGAAAMQILEADKDYDLILCDMMMPEVSGMDLHRWLALEDPRLAEQVIFITGGAFTPRTRAYLEKGTNLWLEKPFDPRTLKKLVSDRIQLAQRAG